MASIQVRALNQANGQWDPTRGQSLSNFVFDLYAVAQIIATRLKLFQGEWFENLANGTPMFQSILGVANTNNGVALIIRERILGTPFVTGIQNVRVVYNPAGRSYAFTATVQTAFGRIVVTTLPAPGNQAVITAVPLAL
jgi:hypothetical protein